MSSGTEQEHVDAAAAEDLTGSADVMADAVPPPEPPDDGQEPSDDDQAALAAEG